MADIENLVIVESPAKAKTIEKFLGNKYIVKSSFGHICDLSKKKLGIDIENGFEPNYEVLADKKKVVSELKSLASKAKTVWLASDEDREGEAISWHLQNTLKLNDDKAKRIVYREITKDAILNAIDNPRKVDMNLVMAQQARRVLDRLVGFELSPILWKKVQRGLSAGRVQSVVLRLVVDREHEIQAFKPAPYYRVVASFHPETAKSGIKLSAVLNSKLPTEKETLGFLEKCNSGCTFKVDEIEKKEIRRSPAPPFTTSTLQQEAARKLGFSVSQTMRVAQALYESGLITYMRTDSTNLSSLAINTIKEVITEDYGSEYSKVRQFHTHSKGAQEAHEAIRPTYASNRTINGTPQEKKLYNLIWKRAVASQMSDAVLEKTTIKIGASGIDEKFVCQGEKMLFDGFLKLSLGAKDDEERTEEGGQLLPEINENDIMEALEISAIQSFTQRPARYSEDSLIKKMEELGIGRPATYATTISTIISRNYVVKDTRQGTEREYEKITLSGISRTPGSGTINKSVLTETTGTEKNKLFPQDIGILVTEYLEKNFEKIMDYGFTANTEEELDLIAEGKLKWDKMIADFYAPFHNKVDETTKDKGHVNAERILGTDPATGKQISVRLGKFGPMAQKGLNEDPEKQFASLHKDQSIETITLEEAMKLFDLPRRVGKFNDKEIVAAIGRFGPYIRHDGKFVSLGREFSPYTVTEEEAIALIKAKEEKTANAVIKEFKEQDIQILNGRFGAYLKHDGGNYKLPKGNNAKAPEDLTLEDCMKIISETTPTGKRRVAKKSTAKTSGSTAKKKTTRKATKKE